MPKGSEALTNARREEIIDACAQLYERLPFKEITLGAIGAKTSFTRTSIYNYFHTKEEIFLALLEREYAAWNADLASLADSELRKGEFPSRFAATLAGRGCLLKLLSMNLYDMESGSRLSSLVAFKRTYARTLDAVSYCLKQHFIVTEDDVQRFIYAFFPFLFGVYPYTSSTSKQLEAMDIAGVDHRDHSVEEIVRLLVERLVSDLDERADE